MSDDGKIKLFCIGARGETPDAKSFFFQPSARRWLGFRAGQFLTIECSIDGRTYLRSYTISSSSLMGEWLSITVKRIEGGVVSCWLHDTITHGSELSAYPPAGMFCCGDDPAGPILLLTAGSGITPAASMIRSLAHLDSQADIVLLHFAPHPERIIFREEMRLWTQALANLRILPVVTRYVPRSGWVGMVGRLSSCLIEAVAPDAIERTVYCCGPAGFMAEAKEIFHALGLPAERFHTESFEESGLEGLAQEARLESQVEKTTPCYNIQFTKSGCSIAIGAHATILNAAKEAKVFIQTSCGKGVCGACRVKVLSGTVELKHQGGIRQREIDQGFILACCSKPTSDIILDR